MVPPISVLCCLDCVLAPTKENVLEGYERLKDRLPGNGLEARLNNVAGERFHNRSPLDFEKLKGNPDRITQRLMSYIAGFRCSGLVIDWRMKELSELVLIRKIRRIRPDLPVVIVSGEISQVMKEWKMENGKWKMENGKWKMKNDVQVPYVYSVKKKDGWRARCPTGPVSTNRSGISTGHFPSRWG